MTEERVLTFLLQVLLILALARGAGEFLRRFGYPSLVGEILAGVLLGPTILGRLSPSLFLALFPNDALQQNMLQTVSFFGLFLLLLSTGLEVDVSAAWRQRNIALRIGIIGVIVPLVIGFGVAMVLPSEYLVSPSQRILFSLFLGTAVAISAIAVIASALRDLDLLRTDLGLILVSGFAVNDLLGWMLFTVVLGFMTQDGATVGSAVIRTVLVSGFAALCLTVGRRMVGHAIGRLRRMPVAQPGAILSFVCVVGLFSAAVMQRLGVEAVVGFFLAGLMAGESPNLSESHRQNISQMAHAVFVPLFFAGIGLSVDFVANFSPLLVLVITLTAILGKFFGAWVATLRSSLSGADRLSVGIAFTPGGAMEIIVGTVAFGYGVITSQIFVAIVVAALVSSVMVGPMLAWSIRRRREVSVLDFLTPEGVLPNLVSTEQVGVLRELAEATAPRVHTLDADTLHEALVRREELGTTGIEKGLAVPHVKVAALPRSVVAFGRSIRGVEWDCCDGLPAHFIFMVLTPAREEDIHVQLLALIARALGPAEVRERLMTAGSKDALLEVMRDAFTDIDLSKGRPLSCPL